MKFDGALEGPLYGKHIHHGAADDSLRCEFDFEDLERFLFAVSPFPSDLIRSASAAGPAVDMIGKTFDDALKEYGAGKTLILRGLEKRVQEVALCAGALGRRAKRQVHVNAYITPPDAQGFPCHYDAHDVVLLQTVGSKNWQTFERIPTTPIETAAMSRMNVAILDFVRPAFEVRGASEFGVATQEMTLREGEILYLPRGVPHQGRTSHSASIHLSMAMVGVTRAELTSLAAFAVALRDPNAAEYGDILQQDLVGHSEARDWSMVVDLEMARERLPGPVGTFTSLNRRTHLTDEDIVAWRTNVVPIFRTVRGDVTVSFSDRLVPATSAMRPAWEFIVQNDSLRIGDIPLPNPKMRSEFVKRLIALGLLSVCHRSLCN